MERLPTILYTRNAPPSHPHTFSRQNNIKRIPTILRALRTLQLKEPLDVEAHDAEILKEEASILGRICRCEIIRGKASYTSELEYRIQTNGDESNEDGSVEDDSDEDESSGDESDEQEVDNNPEPLPKNNLASTGLFDVGFVETQGKRLLWVISPALKTVVKKLLMPHRDIHSSRGIICISSPYLPFTSKYTEIKDFFQNEFKEECDSQAWGALEYFMRRNASKRVWKVSQDFEIGATVSYKELWDLFRPKDKVIVADDAGNKEVLEFISMNARATDSRSRRLLDHEKILEVYVWGIVKDKYSEELKPQKYQIVIKAFGGTRSITSLVVYPIRYMKNDKDQAKFLQDLARRGRLWKGLNLLEQGKCYYYQGAAFLLPNKDGSPRHQPSQLHSKQLASRLVISRNDSETHDTDREHILELVPVRDDTGVEKYMDSNGALVDFESLAFLTPSVVRTIDITTQRSYLVGITESLRKVEWNKELFAKDLIIPPIKKKLLSGLVGNRINGTYKGMGDMVDKKGRGLIVVLHGPPGTGKTFVAEAIAEKFESPLRALSIGELIADPKKLEEKLLEVFDQCRRWNAMLLLDEADVVLEARSFEDIARNAIVSTFLRNLEYFEGIMFLTTNRIGTIDEAFMSRIQIAIHMDTLKVSERKKLWERFLGAPTAGKESDGDKKADERLFLTPNSRRTLLEHIDEWAEIKLNGREIRNTINIAQSLAYTNNGADGLMSPQDIRDAAGEALEFRAHLANSREESERVVSSVWGGGGYGRQ